MNAFSLAPLIIILPGLGYLLNAIFGRRFVEADPRIGEKWSGWFASGIALISFMIGVLLALSLAANNNSPHTVDLFTWFAAADLRIHWAMQIDTLSSAMILVVTGVGSLIHIYAIGYMHGDRDFSKFFAYMNLFLFFMLILVSANNYLMLFVGWEGVGLCSYLLIGFWFERVDENNVPMNSNAARKAFVVNRIGDFGMVLAMILLFWGFGSLEFNTLFHSAEELFRDGHEIIIFGASMSVGTLLTIVTALFLLGAAGKSAQIPLYTWLPDAMAGPTPVSALIHAATMVTAGVYLFVRSNVFVEIVRESGETLVGGLTSPDLVAYTGAATALLAGLIAFTRFDIKKVLAYSTVSQLGFMIAAAGMGAYVAAMFHLITHAFFKALLFLSSGSVIHGMEHGHHHVQEHGHGNHDDDRFDPQDMRTMGGLRHRMKTTFVVYVAGALALSGIVPLAGFWSKDEILAHGSANSFTGVYIILSLAAVCTAFYMGRQLSMVFLREPRHEAAAHAQESPAIMTNPLVVLAFFAVIAGLLNLPFFSSGAAEAAEVSHEYGISLALERWLEPSIPAFELSEAEAGGSALLHLPPTPITVQLDVALISTLLALGALAASLLLVYRNKPVRATDPDPLEKTPIWWFGVLPLDTLYMSYFVPAFNRAAHWLAQVLDDRIWHDWFHDRVLRDGFLGLTRFINIQIDTAVIDGFLVNGAGRAARWSAGVLRTLQTGYVRNYALVFLLGVVAMLAYVIYFVN